MATGRKTVVVGQVIDPDTWGNPLWDQSVQTFASAADRTAQFAAPKLGAVTYLEDVDALEVWQGGWARVSPQLGFVQGPPAPVILGTAAAAIAGLSINVPAGGPSNLIVEWDVQLLNQNSGATREAIVNVALDGAYAGNGSRQKTLLNNEYAGLTGYAALDNLTAAAHVVTVQARASAVSAVALSLGFLRVSAR